MARSTQTLHTCDRCGANATGPLGTRKKPDGWAEAEVVIPSDVGPGLRGFAVAAADLCPACVESAKQWWDAALPNKAL